MKLEVGDLVQIAETAVDVVTGKRPRYDDLYVEGRSKWGTVLNIVDKFKTKDFGGAIKEITKIAIGDKREGTVRWQVEEKDVADNVIKASKVDLIKEIANEVDIGKRARALLKDTADDAVVSIAKKLGLDSESIDAIRRGVGLSDAVNEGAGVLQSIVGGSDDPGEPYATTVKSSKVDNGGPTSSTIVSGELTDPVGPETKEVPDNPFVKDEIKQMEPISFEPNLLGVDMKVATDIERIGIRTAMSNESKRQIMLNMDTENIQNNYQFPAMAKPADGLKPARYDYKINLGDDRYPLVRNMEDELMKFRASVGLPVHGSTDIARAMKYYMYNRFKTPDINLAHTKSFTHIFFTRPDLNILEYNGGANKQTRSNTESAMIWKRHPDLFKLLTDYRRCKDNNNFNMLLSNQCISFDIKDESLSTLDVGRSWSGHEMSYGDRYMGNSADQFSCTFTETSDYSVINMIKLWITYIDNVSRGSWVPSYNLQGSGVSTQINMSHIYTRSLDYAASCYAFKIAPDGEDILYWSKYYGIFPINTGANALTWNLENTSGGPVNLNITFKYSFKRDMSPISLLEFNRAANIIDEQDAVAEASFNPNYGLCSRPYVGAPYIEMRLDDEVKSFPTRNSTTMGPNASKVILKLKFRKDCGAAALTDETMYRNTLVNRGSNRAANNDLVTTGKKMLKDAADYVADKLNNTLTRSLGRLAGSTIKRGIDLMRKKTTPPLQQGNNETYTV